MKGQTLNCYWFLLKFLLKTKTCKLVVGNSSSFTAKAANSEKAIYFLSLMSCSTNKVKSHMLFTCKNFMFSNFTREKKICFRKWWWSWRPLPPPLSFSTALNIHKKTSALESIFNKAFVLHACSFIKKKLEQRYFPVNTAKFLRTVLFIEHTHWQLLLLPLPFKIITEKIL